MTETTAPAPNHGFFSLHRHGFVRLAACTVPATVGDPAVNAERIVAQAEAAAAAGADLALFPELSVSSYAIDDLHLQNALLDATEAALTRIVDASVALAPVLIVGAALRRNGRLYNCAVVIARGQVLGVVPKSYLPNYREYYEKRWFASGSGLAGQEIMVAERAVPFGPDLLFAADDVADFVIHVEICEDYWAPLPPSTFGALAGATVLCNLSASNIIVGKARERALLAASQSMQALAAYAYAASAPGESTTDLAWDGQAMIFELGHNLAESARFPTGPTMALADIDLERIRQERMRTGTFNDCAAANGHPEVRFRRVAFAHEPVRRDLGLLRPQRRFPYVPDDRLRLDEDCYEAFNIQVDGLSRRIAASGVETLVIGVSGGLDSTHALIVAARCCDRLGLRRESILGFTMPGFATGEASKTQAWELMRALGVTAAEIDIRPAARQLLADMGHPFAQGEPVYDVTFENVQAGLRTDYLFRLANQRNGLVVGTGDLSELALGWCTYGVGDQMSHYAVNAGVPKTLIQYLIRWTIREGLFADEAADVLERILAAEISPELVPADESGKVQSTEEKIGPYALHDFFLYHILRFGLRPSKVAFLAWHAWHDAAAGVWPEGVPADKRVAYDLPMIALWLEAFLRRFFQTSQFKRSALPNGPKVSGGGALSPRGDWRAPGDGMAEPWLAELRAGLGGAVDMGGNGEPPTR